jgi:hypothetical protein
VRACQQALAVRGELFPPENVLDELRGLLDYAKCIRRKKCPVCESAGGKSGGNGSFACAQSAEYCGSRRVM